jgi:phosphoribosylformylglycinamidine synthase
MLSESQERMLLVVKPEGLERVRAIVEKWSLHVAAIGRITDDGVVRVRDGAEIVCDVPAPFFTDECPSYVRPAAESQPSKRPEKPTLPPFPTSHPPTSARSSSLSLARPTSGAAGRSSSATTHTILTNTVVPPGEADAAVLRIKGTDRAIAAAIDCNSRYCYLDSELGGRHAVAEATRNVSCVGARPLAITNCLNFGSPEKPAGYYQLDRAVAGMAAACDALGVPVVSGNVSLYNETAAAPVMPTPTVGAVGVIDDSDRHATMRWRAGDVVILVGGQSPTIGATEYLATCRGLTAGRPPALAWMANVASRTWCALRSPTDW